MEILQELVSRYMAMGAPGDQIALTELLRQLQADHHGIPEYLLEPVAQQLGVKKTFLLALIRRYPSLRLKDTHCLELCCGPNCSKRAQLAAFVEKTYGANPKGFELRYVNCMRMCGKGPNIRWDGKLYHEADEALIRKLIGS